MEAAQRASVPELFVAVFLTIIGLSHLVQPAPGLTSLPCSVRKVAPECSETAFWRSDLVHLLSHSTMFGQACLSSSPFSAGHKCSKVS